MITLTFLNLQGLPGEIDPLWWLEKVCSKSDRETLSLRNLWNLQTYRGNLCIVEVPIQLEVLTN